MPSDNEIKTLDAQGLQRFLALQTEAVSTVTERFYATHGSAYARFGPRGREACREDLAYHLEFLRPALEFGLLQPLVDYLAWLGSVLAARAVPTEHLALSLEWLAEFFAAHMDSAGGGATDGAVVSATLLEARTRFLREGDSPPVTPHLTEAWPEAAAFESALLAGNQREALEVLTHCMDSGRSLVQAEMHLIQPALYRIGEKWQANQVSVAQEHLATAIAQSVMTVGLLRSAPPAPINRRALLACVEGNEHVVGLRMVADAFQMAGWDVQYLGANVPTTALVKQALEWRPHLVGLSVSFAQQMPAVKAAITQLGERLADARPAVMIGGLAINRFRPLVGVAAADGYGVDAQAAVENAGRIIRS